MVTFSYALLEVKTRKYSIVENIFSWNIFEIIFSKNIFGENIFFEDIFAVKKSHCKAFEATCQKCSQDGHYSKFC